MCKLLLKKPIIDPNGNNYENLFCLLTRYYFEFVELLDNGSNHSIRNHMCPLRPLLYSWNLFNMSFKKMLKIFKVFKILLC
jgi:hypothetical protein